MRDDDQRHDAWTKNTHGAARALGVWLTTAMLMACAASSRPFYGGEDIAEPLPSLSDVRVLREELQLDLRPLAQTGDGLLHARYQLQNDGEARVLNLFFATQRSEEVRLLHEGTRLTGHAQRRTYVSLGKAELFPGESARGSSFDVPLTKGVQWLDVAYPIQLPHEAMSMVESRRLDYDMAPAQHWKAHPGISLRVQLPEGFVQLDAPAALSASSEPNTYSGLFDPRVATVPHDSVVRPEHRDRIPLGPATLRLHLAPHDGPYYWQSVAQITSWVLALLVPFYAALRLRRIARSTKSKPTLGMRLRSFAICLLFVGLLPWLLVVTLDRWLPHRTPSFLPGVGMLACWVLGGLVCVLGHSLAGRRIKA